MAERTEECRFVYKTVWPVCVNKMVTGDGGTHTENAAVGFGKCKLYNGSMKI